MHTTRQEKLETIKEAAAEAYDLIRQAHETLEAAERETGYKYDHAIMQELDGDGMGTAQYLLDEIMAGYQDDDIDAELEAIDEENEEKQKPLQA